MCFLFVVAVDTINFQFFLCLIFVSSLDLRLPYFRESLCLLALYLYLLLLCWSLCGNMWRTNILVLSKKERGNQNEETYCYSSCTHILHYLLCCLRWQHNRRRKHNCCKHRGLKHNISKVCGSGVWAIFSWVSLKRSRTLWSLTPHPHNILCLLLSVENFSQRISLIREMKMYKQRKTVKGDQIIIM